MRVVAQYRLLEQPGERGDVHLTWTLTARGRQMCFLHELVLASVRDANTPISLTQSLRLEHPAGRSRELFAREPEIVTVGRCRRVIRRPARVDQRGHGVLTSRC
jgi:hypothetical protein